MHSDRSTIEPAICIHFLLMLLVCLSGCVEGRRCVCTSKACKEAGADTCRTKFSCYTELILTEDQTIGENATTRGCTEGATPLLCETKSWVRRSKPADNADRSPSAAWIRMPWPRLKCCDSHDYCNADSHVNLSTWTSDKDGAMDTAATTLDYTGSLNGLSSDRNATGSKQSEPGLTSGGRESDQLLQSRVKPLHVAALVLAIAALISVLAACYVITRFLKANPYTVGSVE
ncbi:uncharacterized protein LOC144479036 [Augochlora pura]